MSALQRFAFYLTAFYLRRSPLEKGRYRLLSWALPRSKQILTRHEKRAVKTRSGFIMNLDLGDWLGRHIFVSGEYEPATTKLVEALLRPGDTMLDIGANVGYFSLLAASRVGPAGRVIAFEPMPRTRNALLENIQINRFSQVEVRDEAVFNSAGMCEFSEGPAHHSGVSSLRALEECSNKISVATAPLDQLISPETPVALIKIDIEGAECHAVQGMQELLERQRPDLIIEVTDEYLAAMGSSAEELRRRLRELGYQMFMIGDDFLREIPDDRAVPTEQFNALFTQRKSLPMRVATS